MTDKFFPLPLPKLVEITLNDLRMNRFRGISGSLFFRPRPEDPFRIERYGKRLETPAGVAAGPHTQLALNIVAAWLCGARYIELKTVQTLDELSVSKPCIDMQDEGYNCEWSQELTLEESFREYLHAWILIHILRKELGFPPKLGTIFNMSVGYDMKGILRENVDRFLGRMSDCSQDLSIATRSIRHLYPAIDALDIPSRISDSVTLSTMHGCPPGEIHQIGMYLIGEKKLHTTIKLNPTLLSHADLREILNTKLGFDTVVPDVAFEHDLKYPDALKIIADLQAASDARGLSFGVKLTNTLESLNNRNIFSPDEKMMYMSGRALHPVSIRVAAMLQQDFQGRLDISFSAGVDCFNLPDVLSCGLKPVTVCSDLLKPGGYGRLKQYLDILEAKITQTGAVNIDDFILNSAREKEEDPAIEITVEQAALRNLQAYASRVAETEAYKKDKFLQPSIKTARSLEWFDCIHAPCADTCPTNQDIPAYMYHMGRIDLPEAFNTVLRKNPFPLVTGMICDHLCQEKCTRINYDEALHIRDIKRLIAEANETFPEKSTSRMTGKFAVIGGGPAGLSCAWFLRQSGAEVHLFETRGIPGGMVNMAIPSFRLTDRMFGIDLERIQGSGIHFHTSTHVGKEMFDKLTGDFDALFLATGAQRSVKLQVPGAGLPGVLDPLQFLYDVKDQANAFSGKHVVIIGGGNTAMDAARTARRLIGEEGSVTLVYRRTIREMPADKGEIRAVMAEGIRVLENTRPLRINSVAGSVSSIQCCKTEHAVNQKGRSAPPADIPGSEFEIPCDTVIPAIGQAIAPDFIEPAKLKITRGNYGTTLEKLYIGGDAMRGASTAINAIGDGRKAALEMLGNFNDTQKKAENYIDISQSKEFLESLAVRKATRQPAVKPADIPGGDPGNFELVTAGYTKEEAAWEASRCLHCDLVCNVCVSVCPNLANFSYTIEPVRHMLQKAVRMPDGSIAIEPSEPFVIEQHIQVLNIRDLCNECGNCTTFCPSAGRPYVDKPPLCLSAQTLNAEERGFLLSKPDDRSILIFKEQGHIRTLTTSDNSETYIYETDQVRATFRKADFSLVEVEFLTPCVKEFHFRFAAEMSIILQGAIQLS